MLLYNHIETLTMDRRRLLIGALAATGVPRASAECWTRSDGVRVCSADPAGWLAVWWFWFALLLLAALVTGCWDSCGAKRVTSDEEAEADDGNAKAAANAGPAVAISVAATDAEPFPNNMREPLLEQPEARKSSLKKPNYRYL